jgi:hypothetical protein
MHAYQVWEERLFVVVFHKISVCFQLDSACQKYDCMTSEKEHSIKQYKWGLDQSSESRVARLLCLVTHQVKFLPSW